MKYIEMRTPEEGKCNICRQVKRLTWDHVPPKTSLLILDTYANTLFSEPKLPSPDRYMKRFQNGIKYRTICSNCNNVILGENDIIFGDFVKDVTQRLVELNNNQDQSRKIVVKVKINRLLRAVCGHFLSMNTLANDENETEKELQEYVLNENAILSKTTVFSWFYPYRTIMNVRNVVTYGYSKNTHPKGFISVMSSFPLAFMISSMDESTCNVDNISRYSSCDINETLDLQLNLDTEFYTGTKELKHYQWPINVAKEKYGAIGVMANEEAMKGSRIAMPNMQLLKRVPEKNDGIK